MTQPRAATVVDNPARDDSAAGVRSRLTRGTHGSEPVRWLVSKRGLDRAESVYVGL
jgi:hypothetical protein